MKTQLQMVEDKIRMQKIDSINESKDENAFDDNSKNEQNAKSEENKSQANENNDENKSCEDDNFMIFEEENFTSFDSMKKNLDWCNLILKHLDCIVLLSYLNKALINDNNTIPLKLSLETLSQRGCGFYREQIGIWATNFQLFPRELAFILSGKELPEEEQKFVQNPINSDAKTALKALLSQFPKSFRPELILCDCCWECASAWYKDESRRVKKLQHSIEYLELLEPEPRLQHGIAFMIWTTFLKNSFENLISMINEDNNKDGHKILANKDRILRRDVLIIENDLIDYVGCVRELLKMLSLAASKNDGEPTYYHFYEDFILDFFQNPNLILGINIPLNSIFDTVGRRAFFEPFNTHPLVPLANVDDRTRQRRQNFLEKVVENIGIGLHSNEELKSAEDQINRKCWSLAMELATDWDLDGNSLKLLVKLYL